MAVAPGSSCATTTHLSSDKTMQAYFVRKTQPSLAVTRRHIRDIIAEGIMDETKGNSSRSLKFLCFYSFHGSEARQYRKRSVFVRAVLSAYFKLE